MPAILVIDDDSHALAAIDAVLRRKRFDVVVARDGRAGLDLFKAEKFEAAAIDTLCPKWTRWRPSGNCAALIRRPHHRDGRRARACAPSMSCGPGTRRVRDVACRYGRSAFLAEGVMFGFPSPSEKNPRRRLDADIRRADGWRA
jgi:hypothetical protein